MANPGLFAYGARAIDGWRARRMRWRTQRILATLPTGILKDIGWPDPLPDTMPEPLFGPRATARRG